MMDAISPLYRVLVISSVVLSPQTSLCLPSWIMSPVLMSVVIGSGIDCSVVPSCAFRRALSSAGVMPVEDRLPEKLERLESFWTSKYNLS